VFLISTFWSLDFGFRWLWHPGGIIRSDYLGSVRHPWQTCEFPYMPNKNITSSLFQALDPVSKKWAGGFAQRWWLLQLPSDFHWQSRGWWLYQAFPTKHHCLCTKCQRTRSKTWGGWVTLMICFFFFYRITTCWSSS